ncbi:MAG TPA: ribonuclease E inhibitor RraB [Planctomycetota bacterium]|nr:ribonuclease E inhibitor RraB [Planctomycetota bacterium]
MITREQIEGLFEHTRKLRRDGEADWDIDGVCLWSYFFVDVSEKKLQRVAEHLKTKGYAVAGIFKPEPDDDDQETLRLQVDKVGQHTVDSLFDLDDELYAVARQYKIQDYDGTECGSVDDGPG